MPLVRSDKAPDDLTSDPWKGWTEHRRGTDPRTHYFGAGHPGVIWWNVRTKSAEHAGIGLSSFEWIANHYRIIGIPANLATEAWWKKLKRLVKRQKAIRIPRSGSLDGADLEIWTLPSAVSKIGDGMPRDKNP